MHRAAVPSMTTPIRILGTIVALAVATLLGPALASVAFAEEDAGGSKPDYTSSGFYLYAGGVVAFDTAAADELNRLIGVGPVVDVDKAIGFNARVGRRANRWLASELQVEALPSFDLSLLGLAVADYSMVTITVNTRVYVLPGRLQPFVLFGVGGAIADLESPILDAVVGGSVSTSSAGFALRAGGGFELCFTEHVSGVVDFAYVYPTGGVSDLDYVSIGWGLQYRF